MEEESIAEGGGTGGFEIIAEGEDDTNIKASITPAKDNKGSLSRHRLGKRRNSRQGNGSPRESFGEDEGNVGKDKYGIRLRDDVRLVKLRELYKLAKVLFE